MEIERIGVVGAGQMGTGIAQVAAQAGLEVRLMDVDLKLAQAACQRVDNALACASQKGQARRRCAQDDRRAHHRGRSLRGLG